MAVNNSNQIGTREPIDLDEIKSVQSTGPSSGSVEFVLTRLTEEEAYRYLTRLKRWRQNCVRNFLSAMQIKRAWRIFMKIEVQ